MAKFQDLLNFRFRAKDPDATDKMTALVERAASGDLSSFSGVFRVAELNETEKQELAGILREYRNNDADDVSADLKSLEAITSEVKAITNQAVILHGERIKRAQDLFKHYRDGAFTAWLFATYGNRQTPYNFLQYYEFYHTVPSDLHAKIDQMPRQVVYTLASRAGELEKKRQIIESYSGQPKKELLTLIRKQFPLPEDDRRHPNFTQHALQFLRRAKETLRNPVCVPSEAEKGQLKLVLEQLRQLVDKI